MNELELLIDKLTDEELTTMLTCLRLMSGETPEPHHAGYH